MRPRAPWQYAFHNCPIAELINLSPGADKIVPYFGSLFLDEKTEGRPRPAAGSGSGDELLRAAVASGLAQADAATPPQKKPTALPKRSALAGGVSARGATASAPNTPKGGRPPKSKRGVEKPRPGTP